LSAEEKRPGFISLPFIFNIEKSPAKMRLRVATSKSSCVVKMIGGGGTTTKVFPLQWCGDQETFTVIEFRFRRQVDL